MLMKAALVAFFCTRMSMSPCLAEIIQQEDAVLVLFGAPTCHVCGDIKPHLFEAIQKAYPSMKTVYVNCNDEVETCAQRGIFSLPVVHVYLQGQKFVEKIRVFSIAALIDELARPMMLMQS
jgi:thioredoxin-like negative regulator of GroEL